MPNLTAGSVAKKTPVIAEQRFPHNQDPQRTPAGFEPALPITPHVAYNAPGHVRRGALVESRVQRRLAAILAADMVGYSRLMAADEVGTLARLKAVRADLIDPTITKHAGRIVKEMGDGLLVEFASVVNAVQCAVGVQEGLVGRNADEPEDRRIEFRIGINLGDVIAEGDDIFGDSVNLAARLENLAEPGGIRIAGKVYEEVKGKLDLCYEDLGEQHVKNIPEPVRVYGVKIGTETTAGTASIDTVLDRPAVAVLPFVNMSGDPEQAYFADGISEDLITALAHFRWFPVIARNSTFAYKAHGGDVRKVARELGARYVIEGSVRKSGSRVRVTAQLIDAGTGFHIWAEAFDRELHDLFALQDEITRRVAAAVAPELEKAEHKRAVARTTKNLTAWDLCAQGMGHLEEFTKEGNAQARKLFEEAVRLDPTYSYAHACLAYSHQRDAFLRFSDTMEHSIDKYFEAAQRAVHLDDSDAFGHWLLAHAYGLRNEYQLALPEAERAIQLNPSDPHAHAALGTALVHLDRPAEAISELEAAVNLNPQDPRLHFFLDLLAVAHMAEHDFDAAANMAQRSLARRRHPMGLMVLASAFGNLEKNEEGAKALAECEQLHPGFISSWIHRTGSEFERLLHEGLGKVGWKG